MREIKFRAWDKDHSVMIYFGELEIDYTAGFWKSEGIDNYRVEAFREADGIGGYNHDDFNDSVTAILMQYTGLKIGGKDLYEKDKVRFRESSSDDWNIGQVEYCGDRDYPAFDVTPSIDCDSNGLSYIMAVCEAEIIGNVYE